MMSPKQRILAIRLMEKYEKYPEFSSKAGIKIAGKKNRINRVSQGKINR